VRHRGCRAQRGNRGEAGGLPGAAMDTQEARQWPPGARANRHDGLIPTQITKPVAYAPNMIRRLKINRRRRGCGHCGQLHGSCPSGCGQREALSKVVVGRPWRAPPANASVLAHRFGGAVHGLSTATGSRASVHSPTAAAEIRERGRSFLASAEDAQERVKPSPQAPDGVVTPSEANRPACARLRRQGAASLQGVSSNELGQDRLNHGRFDPTRPQRLVAKDSPVRGGGKAPKIR